MKKLFVFIVFSTVLLSSLFSDDFWDSQITAYKTSASGGTVPAPVCTLFRILGSNDSELSSGDVEWIPISSRKADFNAFTWVLGGNVFGSVYVSFEFKPMYIDTENKDDYIPYEVELNHNNSRIGNTAISTSIGNGTSPTTSYAITNDFTSYNYYYVDSANYDNAQNSTTIINQPDTITIVYDMSKNTVIKEGTTVIHNRNEQTGAITNYSLNVCNYWNRYGAGTVKLLIESDGTRLDNHPLYSSESTKFASGNYYAEVVVSISTNR